MKKQHDQIFCFYKADILFRKHFSSILLQTIYTMQKMAACVCYFTRFRKTFGGLLTQKNKLFRI